MIEKITLPKVLLFEFSILLMALAYSFYQREGMVLGHIQYAEAVDKGKIFIHPAPGFFWLTNVFHHLTSLSITQSLYILLSFHVGLTFCVIMWTLKLLNPYPVDLYVLLLGALALMVASPIGLPFMSPKVYNFALENRSTLLLRNATHTALLPYAIAAFGLLAEIVRRQITLGTFPTRIALAAAVLLSASSLIKPSFVVSIIPAIFLYVVLRKNIAWKSKLAIIFTLLPAACILLGQIYIGLVYNPDRPIAPLTFSPWTVWSMNNTHPLVALALAIAFPAFVWCFRRRTLAPFTTIAWINLGISIIPYILFSWGDRDMEWPYLNARILLFLCSAIEWWKWMEDERRQPSTTRMFGPAHMAGLLLLAHTLFGILRLLCVDIR